MVRHFCSAIALLYIQFWSNVCGPFIFVFTSLSIMFSVSLYHTRKPVGCIRFHVCFVFQKCVSMLYAYFIRVAITYLFWFVIPDLEWIRNCYLNKSNACRIKLKFIGWMSWILLNKEHKVLIHDSIMAMPFGYSFQIQFTCITVSHMYMYSNCCNLK